MSAREVLARAAAADPKTVDLATVLDLFAAAGWIKYELDRLERREMLARAEDVRSLCTELRDRAGRWAKWARDHGSHPDEGKREVAALLALCAEEVTRTLPVLANFAVELTTKAHALEAAAAEPPSPSGTEKAAAGAEQDP